jgi:regulatory protein
LAEVRDWLRENVGTELPPDLLAQRAPHHAPRPGRSGRGQGEADAPKGRQSDSRGRQQAPQATDDDDDADPETVARTIVLRKLAAQARTRHELAKALASRDVPEDVAEQVLDRMESVGLVDDAAFARDWVESRQQRRHLSKSALRRELQTRGVDRDQIDQAVADVESDDELAAAEALAAKKLRTMDGLAREVQYRRLAGALARRGFGSGVTSAVLSRVLDLHQD